MRFLGDMADDPATFVFPCGDRGQVTVQVAEDAGLPGLPEHCAEAAEAAVRHIPAWNVSPLPWMASIRLGGAEEGQRLNRDFRGKDYATNVLSFPADEDDAMEEGAEEWYVGDLFVCVPVLIREAGEQGIAVTSHLRHLVVHGLLHLAGHDHMEPGEAERMEGLEREILAGMGIDDPYEGELA